jgi:hypothetical protein
VLGGGEHGGRQQWPLRQHRRHSGQRLWVLWRSGRHGGGLPGGRGPGGRCKQHSGGNTHCGYTCGSQGNSSTCNNADNNGSTGGFFGDLGSMEGECLEEESLQGDNSNTGFTYDFVGTSNTCGDAPSDAGPATNGSDIGTDSATDTPPTFGNTNVRVTCGMDGTGSTRCSDGSNSSADLGHTSSTCSDTASESASRRITETGSTCSTAAGDDVTGGITLDPPPSPRSKR